MAPRMFRTASAAAPLVALTLLGACRGGHAAASDADADTDGMSEGSSTGATTGESTGEMALAVAPSGIRRLTRAELDASLRDILGDDTRPAMQLLPEDARVPFDNDPQLQEPTRPFVDGLELLARDVAARLVADDARLAQVVGCQWSGPDDRSCLEQFVRHLGRLALRRPLGETEVDQFAQLGMATAAEAGQFSAGIEVIVRAFLQDPEFVYRVELGGEVEGEEGLFELGPFELASRMSFLLWGSTPNDQLLDAAAQGMLDDSETVRNVATMMLQDPRARAQVDRFHALWLGYVELPHAQTITDAMRTETASLLERVIFAERSSWLDLFTADETFVDGALAEIYGLPSPGEQAAWVPWGTTGRQGLLSQGAFLSAAANVGDTSPTKRGKFIREQLMCQPIPPPPPNLNADRPPEESIATCKTDRYRAHSEGSCAACHSQMDPIGFGLENYDRVGRYRSSDDGHPECVIDGQGEVAGMGTFSGPAALSGLLIDNEVLGPCVVQQLYHFAVGRTLAAEDYATIQALANAFEESGHRFDELLVDLVAHETFRYRKEAML